MMMDWTKGNIYILDTPGKIEHIQTLQMDYSLRILQLFHQSTGIQFLLIFAICVVPPHQDSHPILSSSSSARYQKLQKLQVNLWNTQISIIGTPMMLQMVPGPVMLSKVHSDIATAFSAATESMCSYGWIFKMLKTLTNRILRFLSSWDLCEGQWKILKLALYSLTSGS